MAFILLHRENGFCDYEAALVNVNEIVSVTPIIGGNRWHNQQKALARLSLTNQEIYDVKESIEQIAGMLREAMRSGPIPGVAPHQITRSVSNSN